MFWNHILQLLVILVFCLALFQISLCLANLASRISSLKWSLFIFLNDYFAFIMTWLLSLRGLFRDEIIVQFHISCDVRRMIVQFHAPTWGSFWSQAHRSHQQVFCDWFIWCLLCCHLSLSLRTRVFRCRCGFPLFFFFRSDRLPHDRAMKALLSEVLKFGLVLQTDFLQRR